MLRVGVVGSAGFIGRGLLAALKDGPEWTVAATRVPRSKGEYAIDITNPQSVRSFFRRVGTLDVVVHLAAIAHSGSTASAEEYSSVNHAGVRNVLSEASLAKVKRFVFYSSALVYGPSSDEPLREGASLSPVGLYATSKARAEEACMAHGHIRDVVILRPPTVYAPQMIVDLRKKAYVPFTGNRLLLGIDGEQPRYSLCSLENVISATLLAVRGSLDPGPYNVADGMTYAQEEVARVISTVDGVSRRIMISRKWMERFLVGLSAVLPAETTRVVQSQYHKLFDGLTLNIDRIRSRGFSPCADLRSTLQA